MSDNKKKLLIIAAAVVVMAILLTLLTADFSSCASDSQEDSNVAFGHGDSTSSSDLSSDNTLLINRESDDCEKLLLKNTEGDYTITRSATTGELEIAELGGLPINTGFVELAWYEAQCIGYSRIVSPLDPENPDYSQYGLDAPQVIITGWYSDGTTTGLKVGSAIPSDEDSYYIMVDGVDGIYITTLNQALFQGNKYWLADEIYTGATAADISRVTASGEQIDGELTIERHNSQDKSDPWYNYDWIVLSPHEGAADSYNMSLLVDELSDLVAEEALCAYPTDEQLAQYGLDEPDTVVSHVSSGTSHTLRLSKGDYTTLYALSDSIPVVYQLSADSYPILAELSESILRSTDVHVRYFETIESLTVVSAHASNTFRMERVPLSTDSTLYEYYAYNGESEISLTGYKTLLEVFNGANAVAYGGTVTSDEPYLTITIKYYEDYGRAAETICYYPAGTRRFVCKINGEGDAIVTSLWIDKFIADVAKLAAGESITV